jgi:hypothetical protein
MQAAIAGVVLLRPYVLVAEGDLISARWFLWGAIAVGLSHRAIIEPSFSVLVYFYGEFTIIMSVRIEVCLE